MRSKILYILSLLMLLVGLFFSAWNVFAKESVFCLTDGCHVVDNFTIFGLSLWVYSLVACVIFALLLLRKKIKLALVLLALAIIGDTVLLVLMLFTAPCFNCLIIAFIFAAATTFLALMEQKSIVLGFVALWFTFFIINVGALVGSMAQPFAIYANPANVDDPQNATMRIYFSPSCPSCEELVNLLGSLEMTTQSDISWYPVTESSADIALTRQMNDYIAQGMDLKQAYNAMLANPESFAFENMAADFIMQIRLLVNQAQLSDRGTSRIPFVEYTGLPGHFKQMGSQVVAPTQVEDVNSNGIELKSPDELMNNSNDQGNSILNFGVDSYCDQESEEPC